MRHMMQNHSDDPVRHYRFWSVLVVAVGFLLLHAPGGIAAEPRPADISAALARVGVDASASTIVVRRLADGQVWVSNGRRAAIRYSPASTSKIPHTLIALETGTATPDTVFAWNGVRTWNDNWNRDHTLTSAFANSVVWAYRRIATQIGTSGMAAWFDGLDYGNEATGTEANLTRYWLDGTLRISADEQVGFLSRLVQRQLPLSPATYAAAEIIMKADQGDGWTLYGKTGWWHTDDAMDIGWYVGWLRCGGDSYVFAFNMDIPDSSYLPRRREAPRSVLAEIGAFDCR